MEKKDLLQSFITERMNGKMRGLQSLSTSVLLNEQCKKNATVAGSICSECYAREMGKRYKDLANKLGRATELLTGEILTDADIPFINCAFFRFEAFGDLMNDTQALNYMTIARNNPHCTFALWTKNPVYISIALQKYNATKPDNLIIIYSSLFMNEKNERAMQIFPFIDKVFTVYTAEYALENNVKINCGSASCATCLKCYKHNGITEISEVLKKESKKYYKALEQANA